MVQGVMLWLSVGFSIVMCVVIHVDNLFVSGIL